MMPAHTTLNFGKAVNVRPAPSAPAVLVVCEHASNHVPDCLDGLGLDSEAIQSHVAWDPGAVEVAEHVAAQLSAALVTGAISRLVYDCNRPPSAPSAIPARSEAYDIPGNLDLDQADRDMRAAQVYEPFCEAVRDQLQTHQTSLKLMVTIHSFTPVFHAKPREVEIGLLHGQDARFCEAMLAQAPKGTPFNIQLNEPYSAADGVAHTLDLHGSANGLPNVMIEIRNDLIATDAQQSDMATLLANWIRDTMAQFDPTECAP